MAIRTYGPNAVDWEARVDVDRLRTDRLDRLRQHLDASELGSLLTFDFSNIRYMTATHIGTWAMDKLIRFALLPRGAQPVVWDFGSAARHHQLYNPWLDHDRKPGDRELSEAAKAGRSGARAGISTLRGAFHPDAGIAQEVARKVANVLRDHELDKEPLGVDVIEMPILSALQAEGLTVVDGQQVFLEARRIKTVDEIALLAQACSMVDAAYDQLYAFLRPGVRENACVGLVSKVLYDLGSEYVEGVNAISGERCSPHPHVYSDRIVRPGDPRSSTSCTATSAIELVTTAASPWAARHLRCATPMSVAGSTWTWRSRRSDQARRQPTSSRCGQPRRSSDSPMRKRRLPCSTAMASGWPSGRSRSSAAWCRSTIRKYSRKGWCSHSRRIGRHRTAGQQPDRGGGRRHR